MGTLANSEMRQNPFTTQIQNNPSLQQSSKFYSLKLDKNFHLSLYMYNKTC